MYAKAGTTSLNRKEAPTIPHPIKPITQKQASCYVIPYQLIMAGDPLVVSTYIASMRYATVYNEVSGSIKQYMIFLGYGEQNYAKYPEVVSGMRKALMSLNEQGYFLGNTNRFKTIPVNEHFSYFFGPHLGWRRCAEGQDAKFTVREIQHAIARAKKIRWKIPGHMSDALFLAAYMRMQRDLNAYAPAGASRKNQNICVLDLDSIAAALHWSLRDLIQRLKYVRSLHLCSFRIVEFVAPDGTYKRYLFFSNHGHEGTKMITEAVRRMKDIYYDYTVNYDSSDPRIRLSSKSEVSL